MRGDGYVTRRPIGRRPVRGGTSKPAATVFSLLGSSLVAEWDARFLTSTAGARSWTDRKNGIVLTGTGTPLFGADGANFNALSVWRFAKANLRGFTSGPTTILSIGSPIYLSFVARFTSSGFGATEPILQGGDNPFVTNLFSLDHPNATDVRVSDEGGPEITVSNYDTTVHSWEIYMNGSNNLVLARDGVVVGTSAGTWNPSVAMTQFAIATDIGIAAFADINVARVRIANATPSAGVRAQLLAMDRATWATP